MNTDKIKKIVAIIMEDPEPIVTAINDILDVIEEAFDTYMESNEDFAEIFSNEDEIAEPCECDSCSAHKYEVDSPEDGDIYIGDGVYGHPDEIFEVIPDELESIFTIRDGKIYFGKVVSFNSIKEMFAATHELSKKIRPSRGNLTAPEFRELMNEWRLNMIEDAKAKNGIDLNI